MDSSSYQALEEDRNRAADLYQELLRQESTPEAMEKRKTRAANTALNQTQALASARASQATGAARKQGMTKAQAAMYGGAQAGQGMAADYQNSYGTALAQENLAQQQRLEMAKAAYEQKKELADDKWNKGLSIFSSVFGILSDERLKTIYDKWSKEARKS